MSAPSSTTTPARDALLADAGYGCVCCGAPIIRFVAGSEGEFVLCPDHGRQFEDGLIGAPELAHAAAHPFNLEHLSDAGTLLVTSKYPVARFGGVIFVNDELSVGADGETLLRFHILDGRLVMSLKVYDEQGALTAEVEDNEWIYGKPDDFVLEHSPNKLSISNRSGSPILKLNSYKTPLQLSAYLSFAGVPITVASKGVAVGDRVASFIEDGYAGCLLEVDTTDLSASMEPDPRHGGHSIIVTEREPLQRMVKALNAMASLRSHIEDDPFNH